jgi:hypothetical protein
MTETTPRDGRRIELWVHRSAPDEEYALLRRRLADLERDGVIVGYDVSRWERFREVPERVRLGEPRLAARRLAEFREWAELHGESLPGLGDRRTAGVGRMGPETELQRLPRAVLAEYRGDRIERVTPCESGAACVLRRLAELARRAEAEPEPAHPVPVSG